MKIRQIYLKIILLVTGVLVIYSLKFPLEYLIKNYSKNYDLISVIFVRSLLIIILLLIVKHIKLYTFIGVNRINVIMDNKNVIYISFSILLLFFILQFSYIKTISGAELLFYFFWVSVVGLFEEIWLRGIMMPLIIFSQKHREKSIYIGVLSSAFIFGFLHYFNLSRDSYNFLGVTTQVFYAISFGIFLGAFMLRIGNILVVALFHALFNFIFGIRGFIENELRDNIIETTVKSVSLDYVEIALNLFLIILIGIIGIKMLRKVEKGRVMSQLRNIRV